MESVDLPAGWIGYLFGIATVLVSFIVSWRKGKVDESALILQKWKDLVDTHEAQIGRLSKDFQSYRDSAAKELEGLRERIRVAEHRIAELEETVAAKNKHIAGLERQIAQGSQSTAALLGRRGRPRATPEDDDAVEKLDRAGDNSVPKP